MLLFLVGRLHWLPLGWFAMAYSAAPHAIRTMGRNGTMSSSQRPISESDRTSKMVGPQAFPNATR
jgi:hypothetical protein